MPQNIKAFFIQQKNKIKKTPGKPGDFFCNTSSRYSAGVSSAA